MAKYIAGPSVLRLTGHVDAVQPGETFEHDFSETGPEGDYGPAREGAMLASGAMTRDEPPAPTGASKTVTQDSAQPTGARSTEE